MEGTEPTAGLGTTGRHGNPEADRMFLLSSKPLHRFIQREPKSLGIVIVICGCAEILMGLQLARESKLTSYGIYIPFWQGTLFLLCGNLSIYTEGHPSKKMVTVCLAMYVVSFLGILVSIGYRIFCLCITSHYIYLWDEWENFRQEQVHCVEGLLLTSSACVSVLLIFLMSIARLALKSTNTQVIFQFVPPPPPQSVPASN